MKYTTILLDADGTLFDFDRAEHRALSSLLTLYGVEPTEEICGHYHTVNEALWRRFERGEITKNQLLDERFGRFFASIGKTVDSVRCNSEYLDRLAGGTDLLPGALEVCRTLAPHARLCLATNGVSRVQKKRLAHSALRPYLHEIFVSEDLGWPKPDRRYFDRLFELLGLSDRSGVIMLGDSLTSDMLGAARAGIAACWFAPGGGNPGEVPIHWQIASLNEFVPIALTGGPSAPPRA